MIKTVEKHRIFKAYFKKLSVKQKIIFSQRMDIFIKNPKHPLLKVHKLHGNLNDLYAFSLGGDLRVVFEWVKKDHIILYKIGTHNQVYP